MSEDQEKAIQAEADAKVKELKEQELEARRKHFAFIEPMTKKYS